MTQHKKLVPPTRWHDPLQLIQNNPPSQTGRIVAIAVSVLVIILILWAALGKLDIIATAEGKLVPQTLLKIVQPAEAGIVTELLVSEGEQVQQGQIIARLDTTMTNADKTGIHNDLQTSQMQVRRLQAELNNSTMSRHADDDLKLYQQVQNQYQAHKKALQDTLAQEQAQLQKAQHEKTSALEILAKYEQTLPSLKKTADNFADLEKDGLIASNLSAEKQRAYIEAAKNLTAQQASVAALHSTIDAQQKKIQQIRSNYQADLQKELTELQQKIGQLLPNLDKSQYKQGLMELKAPQAGTIKDIATTTVGAVVQPGSVIMTLVPKDEQLYADINIKNEDIGFIQVGQSVQIKLATYPFQRYGMLKGKLTHLSVDATEGNKPNMTTNPNSGNNDNPSTTATYKARVTLETQTLNDPQGKKLTITPGMQVVAEINQGQRSVLEYLLSPVQKTVGEAGRER
ncbi:MAG: HlyD family type I secretion periplasmic adaptor subunit [Undibacterium sp.]|nr:HlyD family type I secretion periplasmic adaptor subunit [Undibacterium sp.]